MSAKILIVEDERDLAEIVRAKLSDAGYRVAVLTDPTRAFSVIKEKGVDLVICDVMMPKLSGYELCRAIRKDPQVYATPILMLSAMGEPEEIQHALDQGANGYLVKPFNLGRLFQEVKDLLAHKNDVDKKNPVSGLPNRDWLQQVVMNKVLRGEKVGVIHLSLPNAEGIGEAYGPERRDAAVREVAELIPEAARKVEALEVYVAHLGMFDFLIACNACDGMKLAESIDHHFEYIKHQLYNKADFDRATVLGKGKERPLARTAIGLATNDGYSMSANKLIRVAMELNKRAVKTGDKLLTCQDALII